MCLIFIFFDLSNPRFDFLLDFVLDEGFVFELDIVGGGLLLVDEDGDVLDVDGELVLRDVAVLEDRVEFELVLTAEVKKKYGGDSHTDVQIGNDVHGLPVLRGVLVVA